MDEIKKYIAKFFKKKDINPNYDMTLAVWRGLSEMAAKDILNATEAIRDAFNYGYTKGYRACQSEIKKGGAARAE